MLLLYLTNVALTADNPKKPYAVSNRNPEVDAVGAIPACESDILIRTPCYDFFWTARNDPGGVIEVGAAPRKHACDACVPRRQGAGSRPACRPCGAAGLHARVVERGPSASGPSVM